MSEGTEHNGPPPLPPPPLQAEAAPAGRRLPWVPIVLLWLPCTCAWFAYAFPWTEWDEAQTPGQQVGALPLALALLGPPLIVLAAVVFGQCRRGRLEAGHGALVTGLCAVVPVAYVVAALHGPGKWALRDGVRAAVAYGLFLLAGWGAGRLGCWVRERARGSYGQP